MEQRISFWKIFYKIFSHILQAVKHNYGLNFLLAGILTYLIVISGLDWTWYRFSVSHIWIFYIGFAPVMLGMIFPIAIPLWLYFSGKANSNIKRQILGLALGQAAILGWVTSTFIKLFTGRIPPLNLVGLVNNSSGFQFGFYRGGWFNGWPSSHTTVAFAMAIALVQFYPNNKWVKIGAWAFALFIGLGVSVNIHWFSDFVAGAFIGYAIGKVVGLNFKSLIGK